MLVRREPDLKANPNAPFEIRLDSKPFLESTLKGLPKISGILKYIKYAFVVIDRRENKVLVWKFGNKITQVSKYFDIACKRRLGMTAKQIYERNWNLRKRGKRNRKFLKRRLEAISF